MHVFKRILMQQADASPGSGAPPAAAPTIEPQANGAAPAPVIDVTSIATQVRDAVFADLRRSGVLGSPKPKAGQQPAPAPDQGATPPSDNTTRLRSLDRTLSRTGHAARLDEKAYGRLERAYLEESPENVDGWVNDYFAGMGVAQSAPTTTATGALPQNAPAPKMPANATPISDQGSPPAAKPAIAEDNLMGLTPADRVHLVQTKGLRWFRDTLRRQLDGRRVRLR